MDPDETLHQLRKLMDDYESAVSAYRDAQEAPGGAMTRDYEDYEDALLVVVQEMTPLFTALDDWLCNGGFLPAAWTPTF